MRTVRVVCPTAWDRQQLAARPRVWARDYTVVFESPDDADVLADFDVLGYVDRALAQWRGSADGVFSSSDYPGAAVAAAIASGLGLPATQPASILRAAHKSLARAVQAQCLPEATPAFQVLDPDRIDATELQVPFPAYVKPAKGSFSVLARRVASAAELCAFLRDPLVQEYRTFFLRPWCKLVRRHLGPDVDGRAFVAEAALPGQLVTVEAFATGDSVTAIGVVDSVRHPENGSFVAFEYPSSLPMRVQERMTALACRLGTAFGLRWTMFNVELTWDPPTDRIGIVELNPRMCGQFADLYDKVDGVHGHRLALDLACGVVPRLVRRQGEHACAASYPLRVFEPVRVLRVPDAADLAAARAMFPGALAWNEAHAGEEVQEFARGEDGSSHRYAVINVGAGTRAELAARRTAIQRRLGYEFAPLR